MAAETQKYTVRGYITEDTDGYCSDEQGADTLKEAKRIAKYWMTNEYLNAIESETPIVRTLIFKGNECLEDFLAA